ncbi:Rv3235 family protein [Nesterenkonia sp. NBAIMH1]|uniref:Rv3235 family protein n=1 Tax=Nesterenkonia sp. NBAIMH1 TaxID=2600320 RepID=UPI0011B670CA|nr:Rv3235 family protein [Nesterenkonia sp. NBAIMH1]
MTRAMTAAPADSQDTITLTRRSVRRFRLRREAEVPRLLRAMGYDDPTMLPDGESDGRRPTELASEAEESRQIQAMSKVVCQAALETFAGLRPAHQMERWLAPSVYEKIVARADLVAHMRAGGGSHSARLQFLSVRPCRVRPGIWEVSVVFADARRVRACALRLEAHRRRWQVTAMEMG